MTERAPTRRCAGGPADGGPDPVPARLGLRRKGRGGEAGAEPVEQAVGGGARAEDARGRLNAELGPLEGLLGRAGF